MIKCIFFNYSKSITQYITDIQEAHAMQEKEASRNVFHGGETDASTRDEEDKDPVMRKRRMKAVCEY